ncbi:MULTISPECIES: hypothetical protein [unclassified Thermosynechococcus]|uniref:hypothetical protein n=1 Tax=unclassified Thermosynechococcus TaxID=2622553 RepID=UPI002873F084|nr:MULTISPECIES: hypothetical protein [unclassified Thermosynechococcus]WNC31766.1 hypothetical protein RHH81_08945 [Thermosynechococcus sp. PKX95]WNC34290.1 hypothetical protein RHH79_08940 [Thermosynechococcus sp. PKX91]WNC36813.1 hypothetical protein RHI11_08935 [Thermosynechococcus sp. WL11]WNC39334.1 hypothetical protein RHI18_08935 [Thermosynechococcus sp. WL17]WNC41855.1 hypothetical protein RHI14_08925 [Thermosynechococcus sp. WL15]
MKPNQYDGQGENLKRGLKAEDAFLELARKQGFQVHHASEAADIHEHWDCLLIKGYASLKVDIKAVKKIQRQDPQPQDQYTWIELQGVRDQGWLFGGHSDYIAFQTLNSFILVQRTALIAFVQKNVDLAVQVTQPTEALKKHQGKYPVYRRLGRSDRLILVETDILRQLPGSIEWLNPQ